MYESKLNQIDKRLEFFIGECRKDIKEGNYKTVPSKDPFDNDNKMYDDNYDARSNASKKSLGSIKSALSQAASNASKRSNARSMTGS